MRVSSVIISCIACLLMAFTASDSGYIRKIEKHRKKTDAEFRDPEHSALREKASEFRGIDYFPPNEAYRVTATLELTPEALPFEMPTSNPEIRKQYVSYGLLHFELNGAPRQLRVYRSLKLAAMREYRDHLFLPFTDLTSGRDGYGGGRYLDLKVPGKSQQIVIDFNLCYNPYCAYSEGWSCPIPPQENFLDTRVEAGPKSYDDH